MDKKLKTMNPVEDLDRVAEAQEEREAPKSAEEIEAIEQEKIQENFRRLLGEARSFIATQKQKKRLREEMRIRVWEKKQLAKLPREEVAETHSEEVLNDQNINSFKNKLRLLNFKIKKVENLKEIVKLIGYLERNALDVTKNLVFLKDIPKNNVEKQIKEMEKKGFVLERQYESWMPDPESIEKTGKMNLAFRKKIGENYKFQASDIKRLENTLRAFGGDVERFESFFESIKKVFPFLLNYLIGWLTEDELREISEIASSPQGREIIEKLSSLGIKKDDLPSSDEVSRLIWVVKKESEEKLLTPESINKIKILRKILPSNKVLFDDLPSFLAIIRDEELYRQIVLHDLSAEPKRELDLSTIRSIIFEEGRREKFLRLSAFNTEDSFYSGEKLEKKLMKDDDYQAVFDLLVISESQKKNRKDLNGLFEDSALFKDEKFIALYQLMKERGLLNLENIKKFDADNFNSSTTGSVKNPLFNQIRGLEKIIKNFGDSIFHPDFEDYLKKIAPVFGGDFVFQDLTSDGRSYLTEIFQTSELKTKILSGQYDKVAAMADGRGYDKIKNLYRFLELKQDSAEIEAEYERLSMVFGDLKYDHNFYSMLDDDYRSSFPEDLFYFFQTINFKSEARYFRGLSWPRVRDEILSTFRDRQSMDEIAPYFRELNFQNIIDIEKALSYVNRLATVPVEKRTVYFQVIKEIENSASPEINRLGDELIIQLLQTENPAEAYRKIEEVFVKNNLPLVGKIFNVFSILYPAQRVDKMLKQRDYLSPCLTQAGARRRRAIIFEDLLKINLSSGNQSLRDYLSTLQEGEKVMNRVDDEGIEGLNKKEIANFRIFLNKFQTLFDNSLLEKIAGDKELSDVDDLAGRYGRLKANLKVREGQNIINRITEMFLRPIGLSSVEEALAVMDKEKQNAHKRGLETFAATQKGELKLKEGDLLKGVDSNYISLILENGSVAKEYLGAGADSDMTPFDTDLSRVMAEDEGGNLNKIVLGSLASGYGGLIFAVKDRGQFYKTSKGEEVDFQNKKLELFETGFHGARHYGIRTGFPTTEIDFMVVTREYSEGEKENLFFEIAKNGFYIPVLDKQGAVVFTPEMYEERNKVLHPELSIKRKDLDEVLGKKYEPSKLVELFKKDFSRQFTSTELGISEGYSLEQHTLMVLGQHEKYFKDFDSPIDIADEKFRRLLLALHDIGKPNAVKMESKSDQHKYSTVMAEEIMSQLDYSRREINLALAILGGDYVGKYAQGQMDVNNVAREIKRIALAEHVEPKDFLELLLVYFQTDAGSYTKDAGGIESLDYLFVFNHREGKMDFCADLKDKIEELRKKVAS